MYWGGSRALFQPLGKLKPGDFVSLRLLLSSASLFHEAQELYANDCVSTIGQEPPLTAKFAVEPITVPSTERAKMPTCQLNQLPMYRLWL